MKKAIIISLTAAMTLVSCSSEESSILSEEKPREIEIYVSVEEPVISRAAGNVHENSYIASQDNFNVFVATDNGVLWNFKKMNCLTNSTATTSAKLASSDGEKLYAPVSGTKKYQFAAVSPCITDLIGKSSAKFHIKTDQSEEEYYRNSDLCLGTYDCNISSSISNTEESATTSVDITTGHALSKILVKVLGSNSFPDVDKIGINKIEVLDVEQECWVVLTKFSNTGKYGFNITRPTSPTRGDIIVHKGYDTTNGVACIIPPQFVSADKTFIRITSSAGYVWTYKLSSTYEFDINKVYEFVFRLNKPTVGQNTGTIQDVKVNIANWGVVNKEYHIQLND